MRVIVLARVRLYREALAMVLANECGIEVAGVTGNWIGAVALVASARPAIAVVDANMVTRPGLIASFREAHPPVHVVAFGVRDNSAEIINCAEVGIAGYVSNEANVEDLLRVFSAVEKGELWCSPMVAGTLLRRVAELSEQGAAPQQPTGAHGRVLTARELEVAILIRKGLMNKEIARRLGISLSTVKNHVHSILEKYAVSSRGEILRLDPRPGSE